MEILLASTQETKKLAGEIAKKVRPGDVIGLYGELGAGKTTFVRFMVDAMGFSARVQSPTFVIMRKYSGEKENKGISHINHVDLYRITKEDELENLGLEEILEDEKAVTLIEWPEIAEPMLPKQMIKIKFEYVDENSRKVYVQNLH